MWLSKISAPIPPSGFELIRDRLGVILFSELHNQVINNYAADLDVKVFVERSNPFDKSELAVINITTPLGVWGNKNQGSVDGTYTFWIDIETNAKTQGNNPGDVISALRAEKILGACRYILEDPLYKTLGFSPPFISRVSCAKYEVGTTKEMADAMNTVMARLTINVIANEKNSLIVPSLIEGYETSIKIENGEVGYFYESPE